MFGLRKKEKGCLMLYTFVSPSVPEKEGTYAPGVGGRGEKDILF